MIGKHLHPVKAKSPAENRSIAMDIIKTQPNFLLITVSQDTIDGVEPVIVVQHNIGLKELAVLKKTLEAIELAIQGGITSPERQN